MIPDKPKPLTTEQSQQITDPFLKKLLAMTQAQRKEYLITNKHEAYTWIRGASEDQKDMFHKIMAGTTPMGASK